MAVWGVPTATRTTPSGRSGPARAGRRASPRSAPRSACPSLAMRVGIVTGEVAVTIGATSRAWSPATRSTPPRGCSRPPPRARSGSTRPPELLTSSAISYADAGSHPLKGKAEPMPLWSARAVVAESAAPSAPTGSRRRWSAVTASCGWSRSSSTASRRPGGRAARRRRRGRGRQDPAGLGVREVHRRAESTIVRWHRVAACPTARASPSTRSPKPSAAGSSSSWPRPTRARSRTAPAMLAWASRLRRRPGRRDWLPLGSGPARRRRGGTFPREDLFAAWTTFLAARLRRRPDGPRAGRAHARRRAARRRGAARLPRAPAADARTSRASSCSSPDPSWSANNPSLATNRRVTTVCTSTRCPMPTWATSSTAWSPASRRGARTPWSREPRASRCSPSRRCAR